MSLPLNNIFQLFLKCSGVSIDTRSMIGNEMFFGLRGALSNGNSFAESALQKGAKYCIIDDADYLLNEQCILVEDTLETLQQLAKMYRATFQFPVIAVTGTNGKTTTKEIAAQVLSTKYKVFATKGNLNNHIGVPISLLSIRPEHKFAIIEMGANHQKEIEFYCSIAEPDFGLITNIGKAHLEGFGGIEGVLKAKSELFHHIMQKEGVVFMHSNQSKLKSVVGDYKNTITYGYESSDYLTGTLIHEKEFATVSIDDEVIIHSHLAGDYNADNILAAACLGKYFDVGYSQIKEAIENYFPTNNRSQFKEINGNYFILDAYNANPSSMKAALKNFHQLQAAKKIVIIGDMLELGIYSEAEHLEILQEAESYHFDTIVTVGPEFMRHRNSNCIQFMNSYEAKEWFREQNFSGVTILLKGSRGMMLEKVINNK